VADQRGTVEGGPVIGDREARLDARNGKADASKDRPIKEVRATDIEPYTGLRYLSKLFRFMSVILVMLLVAEVATGMYTQGSAAIPTLLGEASRLIVLAGVLWGTGDLAHLLIDVGHDVRATRILGARVAYAMKTSSLGTTRSSDRVREELSFSDRQVVRDNLSDRGGSDEGPPIP
jgi:hypothetical protein